MPFVNHAMLIKKLSKPLWQGEEIRPLNVDHSKVFPLIELPLSLPPHEMK